MQGRVTPTKRERDFSTFDVCPAGCRLARCNRKRERQGHGQQRPAPLFKLIIIDHFSCQPLPTLMLIPPVVTDLLVRCGGPGVVGWQPLNSHTKLAGEPASHLTITTNELFIDRGSPFDPFLSARLSLNHPSRLATTTTTTATTTTTTTTTTTATTHTTTATLRLFIEILSVHVKPF